MAKCMNHWTDRSGAVEAPLGPYLCGRRPAHAGSHAFLGRDGAFAAWTRSGELLLSVQTATPRSRQAGKDDATDAVEELAEEWKIG